MRYNTTLGAVEFWNGTEWEALTATATDKVTFENLSANGQLGTGSSQLATGDHTH